MSFYLWKPFDMLLRLVLSKVAPPVSMVIQNLFKKIAIKGTIVEVLCTSMQEETNVLPYDKEKHCLDANIFHDFNAGFGDDNKDKEYIYIYISIYDNILSNLLSFSYRHTKILINSVHNDILHYYVLFFTLLYCRDFLLFLPLLPNFSWLIISSEIENRF